MIEYSRSEKRSEQLAHTIQNAKPCGRFSAAEVRALSRENATLKIGPLADLRQMGCPESVYLKILEDRAKKMNFKHETAIVPESGALDVQRLI